jgi:hypothetical protein
MFPGMLLKDFQILTKVCHCQRELLQRKICVNRCKVTYFGELFVYCLRNKNILENECKCSGAVL